MQQSRVLGEGDIIAIRLWIAPTAVIGLLYGVHAVLSLITFGLLCGLKTKAQISLFTLTILTMLTSTFNVALDLWFNLVELSLRGQHHPDSNRTLNLANNISIGQQYTDRLNFLISDGIVVWRAWVLFPRNRKMKAILILCMIISIAGTYLETAFITSRAVGLKDFKLKQRKIYLMPICVLLTNVTATSLIGYKAWYHHMAIKRNLDTTDCSVVKIRKILVFLTESGLVYCVLWVIYAAIVIFTEDDNNILYELYSSAMPDISAIYPILIILVVRLENSTRKQGDCNTMLSQSIRFASEHGTNSDSKRSISKMESSTKGGKNATGFVLTVEAGQKSSN
ncbi:hypothetical protein K435DRAFT_973176 [Dendrothele bispora CBS 962.96]|uniref:Family A G protein-coupled receptor-like protein n=1 Tax=Dendrothele bispora (strain CBS 962.96) TaxID=1314807 RepID=A0A4S8KU81_DENBC|nr:hypothetical protein K435DRAFT_973176 [Dendrothele bispora CBS 962.96]